MGSCIVLGMIPQVLFSNLIGTEKDMFDITTI